MSDKLYQFNINNIILSFVGKIVDKFCPISCNEKTRNRTAIATLNILSYQRITTVSSIAMDTKALSWDVHPLAVTRVISHQEQESRAEGAWPHQPQVCKHKGMYSSLCIRTNMWSITCT